MNKILLMSLLMLVSVLSFSQEPYQLTCLSCELQEVENTCSSCPEQIVYRTVSGLHVSHTNVSDWTATAPVSFVPVGLDGLKVIGSDGTSRVITGSVEYEGVVYPTARDVFDAVADCGCSSGSGSGSDTYLSSLIIRNDSLVAIMNNGNEIPVDLSGITGGSGSGDTVTNVTYDGSTLTVTTDMAAFPVTINSSTINITDDVLLPNGTTVTSGSSIQQALEAFADCKQDLQNAINRVSLVDNGDGTATFTDSDGVTTTINQGWTDVEDNGSGTITVTYPDGSSEDITISSTVSCADVIACFSAGTGINITTNGTISVDTNIIATNTAVSDSLDNFTFIVNAGTTENVNDDGNGTAIMGRNDTLHFWTNTLGELNVVDGSAIVEIQEDVTNERTIVTDLGNGDYGLDTNGDGINDYTIPTGGSTSALTDNLATNGTITHDAGDGSPVTVLDFNAYENELECADTIVGAFVIGQAVSLDGLGSATVDVFDGANIPDRVIVQDNGDGTYLAAHCGCWEQATIAYTGGEDFYYHSEFGNNILNQPNDSLEINLFEIQPDGAMCVDVKAYTTSSDSEESIEKVGAESVSGDPTNFVFNKINFAGENDGTDDGIGQIIDTLNTPQDFYTQRVYREIAQIGANSKTLYDKVYVEDWHSQTYVDDKFGDNSISSSMNPFTGYSVGINRHDFAFETPNIAIGQIKAASKMVENHTLILRAGTYEGISSILVEAGDTLHIVADGHVNLGTVDNVQGATVNGVLTITGDIDITTGSSFGVSAEGDGKVYLDVNSVTSVGGTGTAIAATNGGKLWLKARTLNGRIQSSSTDPLLGAKIYVDVEEHLNDTGVESIFVQQGSEVHIQVERGLNELNRYAVNNGGLLVITTDEIAVPNDNEFLRMSVTNAGDFEGGYGTITRLNHGRFISGTDSEGTIRMLGTTLATMKLEINSGVFLRADNYTATIRSNTANNEVHIHGFPTANVGYQGANTLVDAAGAAALLIDANYN